MTLAPIIIFTYRRKIDELIISLLENRLAIESELYIFSDGYKSDNDKKDVLDVRENLKSISGFKKITIEESSINNGLATSVINGVTKVINEYEKVIVLEDDLIVSSDFLNYMNEAINFYKDEENIWSISGYTPPFSVPNSYDKDIFLSLRANSWGWATWKNRWEKIDWAIGDWKSFKEDTSAIKEFNKAGNDLFKMLEMQMLGKIDSWAVRWTYNQYKYNQYTVYPTMSKIMNMGFDDKGTHSYTGVKRWKTNLSDKRVVFEVIEPNSSVIKAFSKHYDLKLKTKIGYFLKKYGGYKLAKKLLGILK